MNSVSFDMMTLLGANGFGTIGTDLFCFAYAPDVDAQVCVMDVEDIASYKENPEQSVFKVIVRGGKEDDMNTAFTLCRSIHDFLEVRTREIISGTEYLEYEPMNGVITHGRDPNDRAVFSTNFYTFRNPEVII